MTYLQVAETLENFITGQGGLWDWDDFTTGVTFKDDYLKQVQNRMSGLSNEFPPLEKGHYCNPEGIKVIERYLIEIRARAAK